MDLFNTHQSARSIRYGVASWPFMACQWEWICLSRVAAYRKAKNIFRSTIIVVTIMRVSTPSSFNVTFWAAVQFGCEPKRRCSRTAFHRSNCRATPIRWLRMPKPRISNTRRKKSICGDTSKCSKSSEWNVWRISLNLKSVLGSFRFSS